MEDRPRDLMNSPTGGPAASPGSGSSSGLSIALVHYPVLNRLGEVIASTVDSFDFFDASRLALTYGVDRLYIVHPHEAQQALVRRLIEHGQTQGRQEQERGHFEHSVGVLDLEAAVADVQARSGVRPRLIATTAKSGRPRLSLAQLREELSPTRPQLWLIGKSWGMTSELIESSDAIAASIDAGTGYNHLSVRSALAIYIDRMLAPGR